MSGKENSITTGNIEKAEVLNIIFARHLRDQNVAEIA